MSDDSRRTAFETPVWLCESSGPPAPQVGDAWGALAGLPPVARLVSTAQPSIDFALSKYLEAHDSLVAAPSYNKCGSPAVGRAHGPSAVGTALGVPAVATAHAVRRMHCRTVVAGRAYCAIVGP